MDMPDLSAAFDPGKYQYSLTDMCRQHIDPVDDVGIVCNSIMPAVDKIQHFSNRNRNRVIQIERYELPELLGGYIPQTKSLENHTIVNWKIKNRDAADKQVKLMKEIEKHLQQISSKEDEDESLEELMKMIYGLGRMTGKIIKTSDMPPWTKKLMFKWKSDHPEAIKKLDKWVDNNLKPELNYTDLSLSDEQILNADPGYPMVKQRPRDNGIVIEESRIMGDHGQAWITYLNSTLDACPGFDKMLAIEAIPIKIHLQYMENLIKLTQDITDKKERRSVVLPSNFRYRIALNGIQDKVKILCENRTRYQDQYSDQLNQAFDLFSDNRKDIYQTADQVLMELLTIDEDIITIIGREALVLQI